MVQHARAKWQGRDLSCCLIDDDAKSADLAEQDVAILTLGRRGVHAAKHAEEPGHDPGGQVVETVGQGLTGAGGCRHCQHGGSADDPDQNFGCAGDGEVKDDAAGAAGGTEGVAGDDGSGEPGEGSSVGGKIAQHGGDHRKMAPHNARVGRYSQRLCGKAAVMRTMTLAPTTVPINRNQPLRNAAPTKGWQTIAAVVPAQEGASSSSRNAT